jgi:hypothetical protein
MGYLDINAGGDSDMNDEFLVTVDGREYRCVTTGDGSDFLVEHCVDDQNRPIECDLDIYEAALHERTQRLLGACNE